MAQTRVYLGDTSSSLNTGADDERRLNRLPGASEIAYSKDTVSGPVTPPDAVSQLTRTPAGAGVIWYSDPLDAVTISGNVTFNVWSYETSNRANAGITGELLRAGPDGGVISVIAPVHAPGELGKSMALETWVRTPAPTALANGDRLALRLHMADGGGTMLSGYSVIVSLDGPTAGASGDTWFQVAEALAPARPSTGSITGLAQTQFTATWSLVDGATGYTLAVSPNPGASPSPISASADTGDVSAPLSPLTSNTTYYSFVRTHGPGASSSWAAWPALVTPAYAPSFTEFTGVSSYSAVFNWSDGGNHAATLYRVVMSTASDPLAPFGAPVTSSFTYDTFLSSSGLMANTAYNFRVAAVNRAGVYTAYTPIVSTYTLAAMPMAEPFSGVSGSGITASWTSGGNPSGTLYRLLVSTAPDPDAPGGAAVTQHETYNLSLSTAGLAYNTTYYFRASAVNGAGAAGAYFPAASTSTLAAAPIFSAFSEETYSSMRFAWTSVNPAGTLYRVLSSTAADPSSPAGEAVASSDTYSLFLSSSGLAADTRYYFRAAAVNHNGVVTAYSSPQGRATLLEFPPAAPAFGTVTGTAIGFSFSPNGNPDGTLYRVVSSTAPDPASPGGAAAVSSDTYNVSLSSTGLSPNVTYYFRAAGVNKDGVLTDYTAVSGTSTLAAVPSGLTFTSITTDTIRMDWASSGGPGTLYTVLVSTAADPLAPAGAAVTSSATYNLYLSTTGLDHTTEYSFRARAVNNNAEITGWSAMVSTTTLSPGTLPAPLSGALVPHVSSMTASWSLVNGATGYTLAASLFDDDPPTDIFASSSTAPQLSAQVEGLSPDTVYYFFVRADGDGVVSSWSGYSPAATLLEHQAAFGSFTGVGTDSVSLDWTSSNAQGTLYRVLSSTAADPLSPDGAAVISSDTYNLSLSSSALPANVRHYFRIAGVNKDGVPTAWTAPAGTSTLAAQPVFSGFSDPGTSAVTFSWSAGGNPAGTLYRVLSSTAPDPLSPGGAAAVSSDTYSLSLSTAGLSPNTSYYFRAAAVNNDGVLTVWTDAQVNPTLPEDAASPAFGTVDEDSADFMWSGGANPSDTLYRVLSSVAPDPLNPGDEAVASSDTYNLYLSSSGLALDTPYYFRAAALGRDGQPRAYTATERVRTLVRPPLFSHFGGVAASSIRADWDGNGNPGGTLYRVAVSTAADPLAPAGAPATLLDSYALYASSSGLSADTTYYFRVAGVNGDGVLTSYTSARGTATLVAYAPLFLEFTDIQTDSIRIRWSANGNGDGTLYRVAVSTAPDPLNPGTAAATYADTYELSLASSGLVTNTLYYFRVAAVNKNGVTTAWTAAQSQATLQASTKLYLRDEVSPANPGADEERLLAWRRGSAAVTYTKNTPGAVTPPTAASQFTKTGGGAVQTWYTPPLDAVTIVSSVTFNIWAMESAIQANAGLTAELLRSNAAGTPQSVIAAVHVPAYELGTAMQAWSWTVEPSQTALSLGDRLALRLHLDDAGGTMAGNRQAFASVGGPTAGAEGDSWVQLLEDIRPARPASGSVTGAAASQLSASWSLVGETTGYTLASSVNPGAEPLPVYSSSQTLGDLSATLSVPALSANTTYYLFVKSNMPGASSGWYVYPGTATRLAYNPAFSGFGTVASNSILFDWSANGNADPGTLYRVVSSTAPDPLSPGGAVAVSSYTYNTYISSAGLYADTIYYFRVAGVNHSNVPTAYTAAAGTATLLGYPPVFSAFTGVTETAMRFEWTPNGNAAGTLYRVVSSTAPDPLSPGGAVAVSSLTYNTHLSTAGLSVNTTYYFRVAGVNKNGVFTAYTAAQGAATLAYTPAFGSITGVSASAISLDWTPGGNPDGTLYRVISSTADPAVPAGALVASSDTYGLALSSGGLAADTTYYFRVAALNRGGEPSAYTAMTGTATLLAFPPVFDPFGEVTASSIWFNFSDNGNAAGTLYRVVSSTAPDPLSPGGAVVASSDTYNLHLSSAGLPADTTHYFRVAGVNKNGVETAYTAARGTATLLAFPPAFGGFGPVDEGAIQFGWTHNNNAAGTLYRVLSSTAPDPLSPGGAVALSSDTYNISLTSASLRADTTYYFRAAGVNKNGVLTDWTAAAATSTLANVPSGFYATGVTEDSMLLNWTSAGNREPGTLYRVLASTAADPLLPDGAVVTSSDTYNLYLSTPGLIPSTGYYFRARAVNNNGFLTDWSDPPFSQATLAPGSIGSPASGDITEVRVSSLAASWSLVDTATGYTLAASLSPANPPLSISASSDTLTGDNSAWLEGLSADTVYYLFARANKQYVSGDWFAFPAKSTLLEFPPVFDSFSGVEANSAQFNFGENGNAFPGTKFRVLVSTAPDPLSPGAAAFSSSDTYNVALSTEGLSADTTYYFRAAGVNKDGILTGYTAVQSTATPANIPVPAGFAGVGAGEMTFAWSHNGNRSPGTRYRVLVSTAADPLAPGAAVATSSETYNLYLTTSGLAADTTYYFRTAALGVNGLSTAYSAAAGTATLVAYPPVFSAFAAVSTGSARFEWSANGNRDPGTRYRVLASTAPDPLSPGGAVVNSSDTYNLHLSSAALTPNSTRYFTVAAVNHNGVLTSYAAPAGTATLANIPLTSVSTFSAVTSGGFTAAWTANSNPAGTMYQVQVSTAQNFNAAAAGQTASTAPVDGYSYAFSGLLSNRDYYFRVRALNHSGVYSGYAELGSTRTLGLSAPSVMPITQVSTYSITASWSLVDGATGYTLTASENSGVAPSPVYASSAATGGSAAVFSPALALNTTYYLFVRAGGPGDASPWSVYPPTSTLANTPTAPGSPFGHIMDNGFTLSWGANSNPLGSTRYTVQVSTASNFNSGVTDQLTLSTAPAAGPMATFSGPSSDTYYYARVRAHHNNGNFTDWVSLGFAKTLILAELHEAGDGVLVYGQTGNSLPQFRDYVSASNSFSAVKPTITGAAGSLFTVRTNPLTTKQEAVAAYVSNGTLRVLCTDGANWYEEWTQTVGGTDGTRRFDVAFETNTGDAVVLYSRNASGTNELGYRTKPGSAACGSANWSSAQTLDPVRTSGVAHWVRMAPDRRADYNNIAAIWADSNSDLSAMVWNGSSWENEPAAALETSLERVSASQDVESFAVETESLSGDIMVVWGHGAGADGVNGVRYVTAGWTGGSPAHTWGAPVAAPTFLDDATNLDLAANPASDELVFASIGNAGSDLQAGYWSGSAWTNTANLDTTAQTPAAGTRLVSAAWISSNTATRSVIVYNDASATNVGWYAGNGGAFTAQADFAPSPSFASPQRYYSLAQDPVHRDRLVLAVADSASDLFAKRLTMTSAAAFAWSNADGGSALETSLVSNLAGGFSFVFWPAPPTTTFEQSAYRFFANSDSADVGAALAAQDTLAVLPSSGTAFRLRTLVNIGQVDLPQSGQAFNLQFAGQGDGTCAAPSNGSPASWTDVTAVTALAFNDNTSVAGGVALIANAADPQHGVQASINQVYAEANGFSNSVAGVPRSRDGMWDLALKDNGMVPGAVYCLRLVKADGVPLEFYPEYPRVVSPSSLVLNEAYPSGASAAADWVELYNNSQSTVPLSGWRLDYVENTIALGGSANTVWTGQSGQYVNAMSTYLVSGLSLDLNGAQSYHVRLRDASGGLVDQVQWPAGLTAGQSFARVSDGHPDYFEIDPTPTPGYANAVSTDALHINEVSYGDLATEFAELYNLDAVSTRALTGYSLRNAASSAAGLVFRFDRLVYPEDFTALDGSSLSGDGLTWAQVFGESGLAAAGDFLALENSTGAVVSRVTWQSGTAYSRYNYAAQPVPYANPAPASAVHSIARGPSEGADTGVDSDDFSAAAFATMASRNNGAGTGAANTLHYPDPSASPRYLSRFFPLRMTLGADASAGRGNNIVLSRRGGEADPGSPHIYRLKDIGFSLSSLSQQATQQFGLSFPDQDGSSLVDGAWYRFILNSDDGSASAPQIAISSVAYDGSVHAAAAYGPAAAALINDDTRNSALRLDVSNNSPSGFNGVEVATVSFRMFREDLATPLTSAEAAALFDAVMLVADSTSTGLSGTYEPAIDVATAAWVPMASISLDAAGLSTLTVPTAGLGASFVAAGSTRPFYLVLVTTRSASSKTPDTFRVRFDPASGVGVRDASGLLAQAYSPGTQVDTASFTVIAPALPPADTDWPYVSDSSEPITGAVTIYSDGIFADDRAYLPSTDGTVVALSTTGAPMWTFATSPLTPVAVAPSFPQEEGGEAYLYFAGANGDVYKIEDEGGSARQQWKTSLGAGLRSMLDMESRLYIPTADKKIHCLNKADGSACAGWTFSSAVTGVPAGTPSVDPRATVATAWIGLEDGKIVSLSAGDGTSGNFFQTGGPVKSSPFLDAYSASPDNVLYVTSTDGKIYAINSGNMTAMAGWNDYATGSAIYTSPFVWALGGTKYAFFGADDGRLYKINAATGGLAWSFQAGGAIRSSPVVVPNGYVGLGAGEDYVYFGCDDGKIYGVNANTGALRTGWPVSTGGPVRADPVADPDARTISVGSNDGRLYTIYIGP
ncbi:MAG: fibronectin type III domain-containing protein [Elusimicrobiales bacterium]|nr:fibronectin type III domain-containing protein [Elusimicrobiales bacterium]